MSTVLGGTVTQTLPAAASSTDVMTVTTSAPAASSSVTDIEFSTTNPDGPWTSVVSGNSAWTSTLTGGPTSQSAPSVQPTTVFVTVTETPDCTLSTITPPLIPTGTAPSTFSMGNTTVSTGQLSTTSSTRTVTATGSATSSGPVMTFTGAASSLVETLSVNRATAVYCGIMAGLGYLAFFMGQGI